MAPTRARRTRAPITIPMIAPLLNPPLCSLAMLSSAEVTTGSEVMLYPYAWQSWVHPSRFLISGLFSLRFAMHERQEENCW